jgi:hypothetical protein
MEQGTSRVFLRAENQFEGSKSYFSVQLCSDNHSCHTHTKLQNHIRILPFCIHHDPKYITESITDDYNKTNARSMYKQYTQYLILHLKTSAHVTQNYKNTTQ